MAAGGKRYRDQQAEMGFIAERAEKKARDRRPAVYEDRRGPEQPRGQKGILSQAERP